MFIKVHKSYRDVVAICDKELIGKIFNEDQAQLDVKESFYKGEEVDKEKAKEIMIFHAREDATFNIVGERSVATALELGIISKKGIKKIRNIPFALVLI